MGRGEARYRWIARQLGERIAAGELQPGDRLPTEDELAAEFGVHRLTARQAVLELKRAGLVVARQGMGTFVRGRIRRLEVSIDPVTGRRRTAELKAAFEMFGGGEELVEHGLVRDAEAAGHLGVWGDRVYRITTLARADGEPWLVSRYALPTAFQGLVDGWDGSGDVLSLLTARGHEWRYAWQLMAAEVADLSDSVALEVTPGAAILVRDGLTVTDGAPLCHVRRRCRGDRISILTRYE